MKLPKLSNEQNNILEQLENNNVVTDSVAGSGKTTTSLYIAKKFNNSKILLLTYNAKLKMETREKIIELGLQNLEVHSYHSFCVRYYHHKCFTDKIMYKILKLDSKKLYSFNYDLFIFDESQDISPLYYELICKIYKDNENKKTSKICVIGDKFQSIYNFNKADERFIIHADKLFNFNNLSWKKCRLSESFRITQEMSEFINNCVLNFDRIKSKKKTHNKPRYIICDCFGDKLGTSTRTFDEIKYYLSMGKYSYNDIFVLAPSVKGSKSPIRRFANKISNCGIPIYVPVSDDEILDKDILEGKIVFSTFHQTKGLERKIIIIFNFDNSYFTYYKKNANQKICPNELYVAVTRGLEHLTLFHHCKNDYLSFLNKNNINEFCHVENYKLRITKNKNKNMDISVTNLVKFLPQDIIEKCLSYVQIENVKKPSKKINIPTKTKQKFGYECVCEITGIAVPAKIEYELKKEISFFKKLSEKVFEVKNDKYELNKLDECLLLDSDDEDNTNGTNHKKINLHNIKLENINENELLYISTLWNFQKNGYVFKLNQIINYNWLSKENLTKCINRVNKLNISKKSIFEKEIVVENEDELSSKKIIGYFDCVSKNNIYEFKCTNKLEDIHYLQLAIYMYLNEIGKHRNIKNIIKNSIINIGDKISYKIKNFEYCGTITKIFKNGNINVKTDKKNNKITSKNILENFSFFEKNIWKYKNMNNSLYKIWKNPNFTSDILYYMNPDDIFLVIEYKNDWIKINWRGNMGWTKKFDQDGKQYLYPNKMPQSNNYYLYNILTDELKKLKCGLSDLRKMVKFLIDHKYNNKNKDSDKLFMSKMSDISEKYI